ncbi:serine carboxypeptidase [Epithele typhae]|uniref:serine carboxypeptidase n=1 Tax=Epithele typhae TaxID=378194 RepID=UPI0020085FF1|nr:serine carboxypeptidase [Epithele typhae]KAH9916734.1 serine carboxypeptidase [Epithele typhae]
MLGALVLIGGVVLGLTSVADAALQRPLLTPASPKLDGLLQLEHPLYANYSVRVTESQFCDGVTRVYTGYIDLEAKHLFFYFFESRRDPASDDVVLWLNGGPGGSSAHGLFMENGPCRMAGPNGTERFEHSWNDFLNTLYLDQPVGTGFSYADHGEYVSSTYEASKDIAAFVAIFFHHFDNLKGRKFHMTGESYAGRMIPVFAAAVHDQNARLVKAGLAPINLDSIVLGNGCTNFMIMTLSYYDIQCEYQQDYGIPPIQTAQECSRIKQLVPRCERRLKTSCIDTYDKTDCLASLSFCADAFKDFWAKDDGYNPHDRTLPCKPYMGMDECYPIIKDISAYLNNPTTQATLGVDLAHSTFVAHNGSVQAMWEANADRVSFRAEDAIGALLDRGVRALVYVGVNDFVCNWARLSSIGTERMTLGVEWAQQEAYRRAPVRDWRVGDVVAGKVRSGGGMTFATVLDAGHLTPHDQPVRVLEVVRKWLLNGDM